MKDWNTVTFMTNLLAFICYWIRIQEGKINADPDPQPAIGTHKKKINHIPTLKYINDKSILIHSTKVMLGIVWHTSAWSANS